MAQNWFENWFDSPYYHILYGDRDHLEAEAFLSNLLNYLNPPQISRMLDLACGQGRHAQFLAKKGFDVTGIDLSEHSIQFARQFESEHLQFYKHDMRHLFRTNYFDYVFNFFTSFGYFDTYKDHLDTIKNVCKGLKKEGLFLLDFMNASKEVKALKFYELKEIDGVKFYIAKKLIGKRIVKSVQIKHEGKEMFFEEKVWALDFEDMEEIFKKLCLNIVAVFGDYQLGEFNAASSDRLIIMAQKQV